MAKLSQLQVVSPTTREALTEPQLRSEAESDCDIYARDSAHDAKSLEQYDSPSNQLHLENESRASLSQEEMAALATEALRYRENSLLLAEQSALIMNTAKYHKTEAVNLAPAIAFETNVLPTMKRKVELDIANVPNKRPRGRPRNTLSKNSPYAPRNTAPSLRSDRPSLQRTKAPRRSAGEDVFNIPDDSPLKPRNAVNITDQTRSNPKAVNTVPTTDHLEVIVTGVRFGGEDPVEPPVVSSKILNKRKQKNGKRSPSPALSSNTKSDPKSPSTRNLRLRPGQPGQLKSGRTKIDHPTDWSKKPEAGSMKSKRSKLAPKNRARDRSLQPDEDAGHRPSSPATSIAPMISQSADASADVSRRTSKVSEAAVALISMEAEPIDPVSQPQHVEAAHEISDTVQDAGGVLDLTILEPQSRQATEYQDGSEYSKSEGQDSDVEHELTSNIEFRRHEVGASRAQELLGQDDKWEKVIKAAKSVSLGKRELRNSVKSTHHIISIETDFFKSFLRQVQKALEIYQQLVAGEDPGNKVPERTRARLDARLSWLRSKTEEITKQKIDEEKHGFVQDIYAHAIPKMVFLLKHALEAQPILYSADEQIQSLRQIIRIQSVVVALCNKARRSKVKPTTEVPIIEPTARIILPYLREISTTFKDEVRARRDEEDRLKEEVKNREMLIAREARWTEDRQRNLRERDQKQIQAVQDVSRLTRQVVAHPLRFSQQVSLQRGQWTTEQDSKLLRLLMEFADQPERRYVSVLNTPLLQNKLPEHIKTRALELKPSMEKSYLQDDFEIPQWVSSLV